MSWSRYPSCPCTYRQVVVSLPSIQSVCGRDSNQPEQFGKSHSSWSRISNRHPDASMLRHVPRLGRRCIHPHLLACCPWFKNGRSDPRFENKPSAQVHGANFLNVEVEIDISMRVISGERSSELRIFIYTESVYKSVTYSKGAAWALASKHKVAVRFRELERCMVVAYPSFFSLLFGK